MRSTCARMGISLGGRSISGVCAMAAPVRLSPPKASECFNKCRRSMQPQPLPEHQVGITWGIAVNGIGCQKNALGTIAGGAAQKTRVAIAAFPQQTVVGL